MTQISFLLINYIMRGLVKQCVRFINDQPDGLPVKCEVDGAMV